MSASSAPVLACSAAWSYCFASFALTFGPPEYFLLAILGLVGIVSMADDENKLIKALCSGLLGLIIAVIGTDPISGMLRYTMTKTFCENHSNRPSFLEIEGSLHQKT